MQPLYAATMPSWGNCTGNTASASPAAAAVAAGIAPEVTRYGLLTALKRPIRVLVVAVDVEACFVPAATPDLYLLQPQRVGRVERGAVAIGVAVPALQAYPRVVD